MWFVVVIPVSFLERSRNSCKLCRNDSFVCDRVGSDCPVRGKILNLERMEEVLQRSDFSGASPPSVFVGSWNYPKVIAGPLIPPEIHGDTSLFGNESMWIDKSLDDIINFRLGLLRTKKYIDVNNAKDPSSQLAKFQELTLSSKALDTDISLQNKPNFRIQLLTRAAPTGPSGNLRNFDLTSNAKVTKIVDKVAYDTDLPATPGVFTLYDDGIPISHIVNLFSIGTLGIEKKRRLVPTQWSIVAVDDIVARQLLASVRTYESIDKIQLFVGERFFNRVITLFVPGEFCFEALEGWASSASYTSIKQDHELYNGRKTYADDVAGAYYVTKLAALEYLSSIKRKASILVFMEVHPGWITLGVWRFREILRISTQEKPKEFETLKSALNYTGKQLSIPLDDWLQASKLLPYLNPKSKLSYYLK